MWKHSSSLLLASAAKAMRDFDGEYCFHCGLCNKHDDDGRPLAGNCPKRTCSRLLFVIVFVEGRVTFFLKRLIVDYHPLTNGVSA